MYVSAIIVELWLKSRRGTNELFVGCKCSTFIDIWPMLDMDQQHMIQKGGAWSCKEGIGVAFVIFILVIPKTLQMMLLVLMGSKIYRLMTLGMDLSESISSVDHSYLDNHATWTQKPIRLVSKQSKGKCVLMDYYSGAQDQPLLLLTSTTSSPMYPSSNKCYRYTMIVNWGQKPPFSYVTPSKIDFIMMKMVEEQGDTLRKVPYQHNKSGT